MRTGDLSLAAQRGMGILPLIAAAVSAAGSVMAAKAGAGGDDAKDAAKYQLEQTRLQARSIAQQARIRAKTTKTMLPYYIVGGIAVLGVGAWLIARRKKARS